MRHAVSPFHATSCRWVGDDESSIGRAAVLSEVTIFTRAFGWRAVSRGWLQGLLISGVSWMVGSGLEGQRGLTPPSLAIRCMSSPQEHGCPSSTQVLTSRREDRQSGLAQPSYMHEPNVSFDEWFQHRLKFEMEGPPARKRTTKSVPRLRAQVGEHLRSFSGQGLFVGD